MMRIVLIACLLVASQPLLLVTGILVKWIIACRGGACAGAVDAGSPFASVRDILLTALVVTAPHLLAVLLASAAWLLAGKRHTDPVTERAPGLDSAAHSLSGVAQ